MARATRSGGSVTIRRTQGRPGGTNARLGKAVGVRAIGSPRSASGKHLQAKRDKPVPLHAR